VSFTIRPVTHTAEVDVKKASIKEHPPIFETGSMRINAPARITDRKPITSICGGDKLTFIRMYFKMFLLN
jgi:hypothetical protein